MIGGIVSGREGWLAGCTTGLSLIVGISLAALGGGILLLLLLQLVERGRLAGRRERLPHYVSGRSGGHHEIVLLLRLIILRRTGGLLEVLIFRLRWLLLRKSVETAQAVMSLGFRLVFPSFQGVVDSVGFSRVWYHGLRSVG